MIKFNRMIGFAKTLVSNTWDSSQWDAFNWIVNEESGWRVTAYNPSGATGLCQSLPAGKMSSEGDDYLTNPYTQLKWCVGYIAQRYGTPGNALAFHLQRGWF